MRISDKVAYIEKRSEVNIGRVHAQVRQLERIADAAEKLIRNLDNNSSHPIDMARLRQALEESK